MNDPGHLTVAVLLATYNGFRYIEAQLASLKQNRTPFTLHWLDDHSTDGTREAVRGLARRLGIPLVECHQEARQGVPGAFFRLLEHVTADAYLFCDQDDIWQPGKLDVTVADIASRAEAPYLCFSEPLLFTDKTGCELRRYFEVIGVSSVVAQERSRAFIINPSVGNTVGFNRSLRQVFLQTTEFAYRYATMHDWWLYLLARATGTINLMRAVPTTLYRQHATNTAGVLMHKGAIASRYIRGAIRRCQTHRRAVAIQAHGFLQAAKILPASSELDALIALAQGSAVLCRRQSLHAVYRLAANAMLPPHPRRAVWFALCCLLSDIEDREKALGDKVAI